MYCLRQAGRFAYKHIRLMSRLLSLQPCWPHDEYTHSFLVACVKLASFCKINPRYFFIIVTPARRCPGSFLIFCLNPWLTGRKVRDMYWTCLRKDYLLAIRFILSCPILCPDMCPHIYGTTAIFLSVMLSCLSHQKERKNIQAFSDSPLEVCISTRRVVTFCPWFHWIHCFEFRWSLSSYTVKTGGWCGYHVPGPTRLGKMSKPLLPSRPRFWKPCSGNSGNCHVGKLDTDPSPHSGDGSSAADISLGGFSAAGPWNASADGLFTRAPKERWQLLAHRSHL